MNQNSKTNFFFGLHEKKFSFILQSILKSQEIISLLKALNLSIQKTKQKKKPNKQTIINKENGRKKNQLSDYCFYFLYFLLFPILVVINNITI